MLEDMKYMRSIIELRVCIWVGIWWYIWLCFDIDY